MGNCFWSPLLEKAMRISASAHDGQTRKGSSLPYLSHPAAVALVLLRAGFTSENLLAAAILHDTLEDTDITVEQLKAQFPPEVCDIVAGASEQKLDESGVMRPWLERKSEHIERLRQASAGVLAVVLADKTHNLHSMVADLNSGEPLWGRFGAKKADVIRYHEELLTAASESSQSASVGRRLEMLVSECRKLIEQLR